MTLKNLPKKVLDDIKNCYTYRDKPWEDICNWKLYGVNDSYVVSGTNNPCNSANVSPDGTDCTLSYGVQSLDNTFSATSACDRIKYARESVNSNWKLLNVTPASDGETIYGRARLIKYRIDRTDLSPKGYDMTESQQTQSNGNSLVEYQNIENFFTFQPQADWGKDTGVSGTDLAQSMYMCSLTDQDPTAVQSEQMYAMKLVEGTTTTPANTGNTATSNISVTNVRCAIVS